ncbi:cation-transporting P-type ATPase, partial [Pediococcus acidilactici]
DRPSALQIFIDQFKDLIVIILIVAALISGATGDLKSTIVIIAVLILNAILGTTQTLNAQKSVDSLKSLSVPKVKVIRDGQK